MRRQIQVCCAAVVLAVLTGSPVLAHHSSSAYDLSKSLTLDVTVASVVFTNPHVMLHFDAKTDSGEVQHWAIETNNPSVMRRAGWTKDTLKAGDKLTITFHPAVNGTTNGYIRNNDGKIMFNGRQLKFDVNAPEQY
jgi:hypothetical protein